MTPRSLAAALLVAACGSGGEKEPSDEVVIKTEQGVTIVTNPGLHLADTLAWSIDTIPVLSIGVVEGPGEYMIGRLTGTLRRADGSILVADGLANELRVFDAEGRFVRRVGRAGEGPGEYSGISNLLAYPADSILVMDGENSRATVLDPDLEFVRRYRPQLAATRGRPGSRSHSLVGFFEDGTPLVYDYLNTCDHRTDGFCQDSAAFYRTDADGNVLAYFGSHVHSRRESYRIAPGFVTRWGEPHAQAFWRVHGERFYYADAQRFEYRVFRSDGMLERVVRVDEPLSNFAHDDVFARSTYETSDPQVQAAIRVHAQATAAAAVPDTVARFSDMLVDDDGHVWLREYSPPGRPDRPAPRWFIFDPDGRLRYALRSPAALVRSPVTWSRMPPQIGEDFVLVGARDELGVERVNLYRLDR